MGTDMFTRTSKIFKYKLTIPGMTKVMMPKGATVIAVGAQKDDLCVWAGFEVGPESGDEEHGFIVQETGKNFEVAINDRYVGTVLFDNGAYVVHVFEQIPPRNVVSLPA